MRYMGRVVDAVALWSEYVEFPSGMRVDDKTVYLPLVVCPNPDHVTNKKHFQINIEKGLVHCFANCGISGTFEHAIATIEDVTHRQARRVILGHARIGNAPIPKKRGKREIKVIDLDLRNYVPLPQAAKNYLKTRRISDTSVAKWQLRWDDDELRIVIPAFDAKGRLKFVIKRAVSEKDYPKYLYDPEGCDRMGTLFGIGQINPGMIRSRGVVLVEGSMDTILNHQNGIVNTVGILGSKLSEIQAQQISNLRPKRITTMFDADVAGIGATLSVRRLLGNHPLFVCRYPRGKDDPAKLNSKEAVAAVERAVPFVQFQQKVTRLISTREREHVGN
jgi:DNA primase